jgi:hypothetical protein
MQIDIKLKNGKSVLFETVSDEPVSSTWLKEVMEFATQCHVADTLANLHRPARLAVFEPE